MPRRLVGCYKTYLICGIVPNFVSDFCTVIVDVRFLPGMTATSVKQDIEGALDQVKQEDPDFRYEIEMPPHPRHKVCTVIMEPFDLPKDEYILDSVLRQYASCRV